MNVKHNYKDYEHDGEITTVLNRICVDEGFNFRFCFDGENVYIKSKKLGEDVLDFPYLVAVFEKEWKNYLRDR